MHRDGTMETIRDDAPRTPRLTASRCREKPVAGRVLAVLSLFEVSACGARTGLVVPPIHADAGVTDARTCSMPTQSCAHDALMGCGAVLVPASDTFVLGERDPHYQGGVQPWAYPSPGPVRITEAFCADTYEVTVARFREYWHAGMPSPVGNVATPGGSISGPFVPREPRAMESDPQCNWTRTSGARDEHPVNCVDWATAMAFCVWDGGRLATETEWEWMARGVAVGGLSAGRGFTWGDTDPSGSASSPCDHAQWNFCAGDDGAVTRRVGSFAPTGGLFDLAGNLWEWVGDRFRFYPDSTCWGGAARTDPLCDVASEPTRVGRGGSWDAWQLFQIRASVRAQIEPERQGNSVGFRCVHSIQ